MVAGICFCYGLNDLGQELLCSLNAQAPPWRRGNSYGERQADGVHRVRPVHRSGIRRGPGVNHIVQRVQAERHVVRNPENSVAAAHHHFRIDAVRKSKTWREVDLLQRNIAPVAGVHQKHVPFHRWRVRREKPHQEVCGGGVEIRQPIEPLRPWPLQVVAQA